MMNKLPRPKIVGGLIIKVVTGCGNLYVQLGWWNGSLHEVFATLGRGGTCAMSINEALTRSITAGLRRETPVTDYVRQLTGIRCPTPMPFPKEDAVMSCPDAISKVLREYGLLTVVDMVKLIMDLNKLSEHPTEPLSEEAEREEALERIEELKEEREKQGL